MLARLPRRFAKPPQPIAARGDVYADALSLALLCGKRAEETVSAHWRDIDLDGGRWTILETVTKSWRRHTLILSPSLSSCLTRDP